MKNKFFSLLALSAFFVGGTFASVSVYDDPALIDAAIEADIEKATTHTTIIDVREGRAANVGVEDELIHVYQYTGVSSEAGSTFAENEDWSNWVATPKPVQPAPSFQYTPSFNTSMFNFNYVSDYVMMVDACLEAGNRYDHAKEMCIER